MPAQLNDRALRRLKVHPPKRVNFGCPEKGFFEISHLHISHSASYLPPKILHNFCFLFLLGITAVPREIKNNAYAKFWGADKVHYEKCASGVLSYFPQRLVHPLLPYAIMGGNALLAGLLCMTLPETKGMPTAETMDSEEDEKESIELQVWEHLQDQDLISFVCMIISSEQRK